MVIRENKEAAELIRAKAAVDPNRYRALPDEIKARAFTVAYVHRADALERMRNLVAGIPQGEDWRETRRRLAEEIEPYLGGNSVAAVRKAELLLRTHGFQAYAAGRYASQQETREAVPYLQYNTVGDGNVRDEHAALDGIVLPADDPFWQTHYPPWDFGCRCFVAGVTAPGVERLKEREADKPPAERRVLEGKFAEMARAGRINRGNGRGWADIRPPKEKASAAERSGAYSWSVGTVAPDMRALRERLSASEFKQLELELDKRGLTIEA